MIVSDEVPVGENGFHWRPKGRSGIIYFVENNKILAIRAKVPDNYEDFDILIESDSETFRYWSFPEKEKISEEKAGQIQDQLLKWLQARQWRYSFLEKSGISANPENSKTDQT
ncbi:MAG: hypothetical protein Kow0029_30460 [Candidatus Rifleibacteriota bacterium]